MTAPLSTVEAFIAGWTPYCGPAKVTPHRDNDPCPVLIITAEIWDAKLWAAKFGADERREIRWVDKVHHQAVHEWLCAWNGWHVQVIGRVALPVPAEIVRELTLVGVAA